MFTGVPGLQPFRHTGLRNRNLLACTSGEQTWIEIASWEIQTANIGTSFGTPNAPRSRPTCASARSLGISFLLFLLLLSHVILCLQVLLGLRKKHQFVMVLRCLTGCQCLGLSMCLCQYKALRVVPLSLPCCLYKPSIGAQEWKSAKFRTAPRMGF